MKKYKFKEGDRVRVKDHTNSLFGECGTVTGEFQVGNDPDPVCYVRFDDQGFGTICLYKFRLELIEKEKPMFDMKKESWYILINSEEEFKAARKWLTDQHGIEDTLTGTSYSTSLLRYVTNTSLNEIKPSGRIMWGTSIDKIRNNTHYKEVKLNFKTTTEVVDVTYPEVKSEAQKTLEQLQEQIALLQQKANELEQNLGGN